MRTSPTTHRRPAVWTGLLLVAACATTERTASPGSTSTSTTASGIPVASVAHADSVRHSYVEADVAFMRGMIHHHAQALVMAEMAPTHGASPPLRIMAARIINAQKDEIALMEAWLEDNGLAAPDPAHAGHTHMPGMLTAAQMADLAAASGPDWDMRFLTYMIQHHEGAVTMVEELFGTDGAAQGDAVFKLASDIEADQSSEIDRMRTMLREMAFETSGSR